MFLLHTEEQKRDENQFVTKSTGIKVIIIFKKSVANSRYSFMSNFSWGRIKCTRGEMIKIY